MASGLQYHLQGEICVVKPDCSRPEEEGGKHLINQETLLKNNMCVHGCVCMALAHRAGDMSQ